MNRQKHSHSVFQRWIAPYLVLLVIPIALCIAIVTSASRMLTKEYRASAEEIRGLSKKIVANYLKDASATQSILTGESEFQMLASYRTFDGLNRYAIVRLQKLLRQHSAFGTAASSEVCLLIHNEDKVLTQATICDMDVFMNEYHPDVAIHSDDMLALLKKFYSANSVLAIPRTDDSACVMMLSSLPSIQVYTTRATVIQFLNEKVFEQLFENESLLSGMETYLIATNGTVIGCSGSRNLIVNYLEQYPLHAATEEEVTILGEGYKLYSEKTSASGWYFVTLVSNRVLADKLRMLDMFAFMELAFFMVVFALMALGFVRRQYKPLHQLVTSVAQAYPLETDEYETIQSAFRGEKTKHSELAKLWEAQNDTMQREFLKTVLAGRCTRDSLRIAASMNILTGGCYCVIVIASPEQPLHENIHLLERAEALCGLAREKCAQVFLTEIDEYLVLVCTFPTEDASNAFPALLKKFADLSENETGNAPLKFAVSPLTEDLTQLHLCLTDALSMLHGSSVDENDRHSLVLTPPSPQDMNDLSGKSFADICSAVRVGDADAAHDRLKALFSTAPDKLNPAQRMLMNRLLSEMFSQLSVSVLNGAELAAQCNRLALLLNTATKSSDYFSALEEAADVCCALRQNDTNANLLNRIIDCVDAGFTDSDFNVTRVAEILGMNLSYISEYFTVQNGFGLLEYINRCRINRAKELLQNEPSLSIATIAKQVGFDYPNSFIRIFKKFEGMTPGEFRRKNDG